jgi:hypothetical protein
MLARRVGISSRGAPYKSGLVVAVDTRFAGQEDTWTDLTGGYDSRLPALLLRGA